MVTRGISRIIDLIGGVVGTTAWTSAPESNRRWLIVFVNGLLKLGLEDDHIWHVTGSFQGTVPELLVSVDLPAARHETGVTVVIDRLFNQLIEPVLVVLRAPHLVSPFGFVDVHRKTSDERRLGQLEELMIGSLGVFHLLIRCRHLFGDALGHVSSDLPVHQLGVLDPAEVAVSGLFGSGTIIRRVCALY